MLTLRRAARHVHSTASGSIKPVFKHSLVLCGHRPYTTSPRSRKAVLFSPAVLLATLGVGWIAYEYHRPTRYAVLAMVRCSRIAGKHCQLRMIPTVTQLRSRGSTSVCGRLQESTTCTIRVRGRAKAGTIRLPYEECSEGPESAAGKWGCVVRSFRHFFHG